MKTLSTFNQSATDNPHVGFTRLFEFSLGTANFYLCSKKFNENTTPNTFNSIIYEPLVVEYDDIKYGDIRFDDTTPENSETSFTVLNNVPVAGFDRFSLSFADNPIFYTEVRIYDLFDGATLVADKDLVFSGTIEDIDVTDSSRIVIHCTGPELSIMNKFQGEIVSLDTYPGADPDDIGKLLPIVYGAAKNVPFLAVDAGSLNTLLSNIDAVMTQIDLSDASEFANSGGLIQVDEEQISYVSIVGNQLQGCTRGYGSTNAVAHNAGAIVAELQTSYVYLIGHPVRAIDVVYVENKETGQHIKQSGNFTAYTGQTGNEYTGYEGKACIVFHTLASISRQINIQAVDTIDVDDFIAVPDPSHDHAGEPAYATWFFDNAVSTNNYHIYMDEQDPNSLGGSNAAKLADGNMGTFTGMQYQGNSIAVQKVALENKDGIPVQMRICLLVGSFFHFYGQNCFLL
jgi:hypothetical protein